MLVCDACRKSASDAETCTFRMDTKPARALLTVPTGFGESGFGDSTLGSLDLCRNCKCLVVEAVKRVLQEAARPAKLPPGESDPRD
jgi:hypothetical protein